MKHSPWFVLGLSIVLALSTASPTNAAIFKRAPLPPRNIQIQQRNNAILLTWKKPRSKNIVNFRIYRSKKSKNVGSLVTTIHKNTFSFLDANIQNGVTYFYTIRTVRNGKESRNKRQLVIKTPNKFTELKLPKTPEPFVHDNELEIEPITLETEDQKIKVIIPKGYEVLGRKHMKDLEYCYDLVPQFVGGTPYYDGIILKIFITKDNTNQGSGGQGIIWYARSRENIDADLHDVQSNNPEGFLYKSSSEYCANTHEFVHNVVTFRPIPGEFNEGIAEYTQKHTQAGSKDAFECRKNGWYGTDVWGDSTNKLFAYNLFPTTEEQSQPGAGAKLYHSALCLWEKFDKKFGPEKRKQIFERLNEYTWEFGTIKRGDTIIAENVDEREPNRTFIEEILFTVVGESTIKPFLQKFGYTFP